MMLHTKYQGSMPCGLRQEEFYKPTDVKHVIPGVGHFWPQWYNLNKLGIGPLDKVTYQISRL